MSPRPVIMILDNPPDEEFEEDLTDDNSFVPQIVASSSESDDETATNNGYQLLPQEPDQEQEEQVALSDELEVDETIASGSDFHSYISQMMNEEITKASVNESENHAHSNATHDSHPMEKDCIDKIKALMTNITIPSSAIPDWAKTVPEEEWKAQLVSNIKARHAFAPTRDSPQLNGDNFNNLTFLANFNNGAT